MANQRKKSKVHIGGYFEKSLKTELQRRADDRGISVGALINEILEDAVNQADAIHEKPVTNAGPEAVAGHTAVVAAKRLVKYPPLRRK